LAHPPLAKPFDNLKPPGQRSSPAQFFGLYFYSQGAGGNIVGGKKPGPALPAKTLRLGIIEMTLRALSGQCSPFLVELTKSYQKRGGESTEFRLSAKNLSFLITDFGYNIPVEVRIMMSKKGRCFLGSLMILFLLSYGLLAQDLSLADLARVRSGRSAAVTSSEPDFRSNLDRVTYIKPGETLVMADIAGPAVIQHIWLTFNEARPNWLEKGHAPIFHPPIAMNDEK